MNIRKLFKELGINPEQVMEVSGECACGTIGEAIDCLIAERQNDPHFTKAEYDELMESRRAIEIAIESLSKLEVPTQRCFDLAIKMSKQLGFPVLAGALEIGAATSRKLKDINPAANSEMAQKRNESHAKQREEMAGMFDPSTHRN